MKALAKSTSLLALLTLGLVAIFSVGCGNSDNFVFTGNTNVTPGTTGNLSFRFVRPVLSQTAGEVPAGTTQLLFSLHSGNPPSQANLVEVRLVPYSDQVVLEDVAPSVTTVVVVALTDEGFPLAALQGDAAVVVGTTQPVDLGASDPINFDALTVTPDPINVVKNGDPVQASLTLAFSNGSEVTLTNYDAPEVSFSQTSTVANITSTGVFSTAVGGQNTTASATYNLFGTERSDTFDILTFCYEINDFGSDTLFAGSPPIGWGYLATFIGPTGVAEDASFDYDEFGTAVTAAINPPVAGISLDENNRIVIDSGVSIGTDFTIVITYTDPDYPGVPVSDSITFTTVADPMTM